MAKLLPEAAITMRVWNGREAMARDTDTLNGGLVLGPAAYNPIQRCGNEYEKMSLRL